MTAGAEVWTGYTLTPEDVWFFRDSKPSLGGEDHYLRSIFPPLPSTLFGLVRTQRLQETGLDPTHSSEQWWKNALPEALRRELGEFGAYGTLRMRGPWLRQGDDFLFPSPADLQLFLSRPAEDSKAPHSKGPKVERVVRLRPVERERGVRCDWSHSLPEMRPYALRNGRWTAWQPSDNEPEPQNSSGWYLKLAGMQEWIAGGVPAAEHFVPQQCLWQTEMRTGVGLAETQRVHQEGRLFTFGFIRLCPGVTVGFDLAGGKLKADAWARFGGENRLARIGSTTTLAASAIGHAVTDVLPNDGRVVTLATPAVFDDGAGPKGNLVQAAVVTGSLTAGGWDLAKHEPKPLQRAAPAGSVYWTKQRSDQRPTTNNEAINDQRSTINEPTSAKHQEGFGLMIAGRQPGRDDG